jgi:hypothetical protein
MIFDYYLSGWGWANLHIKTAENEFTYAVSYIGRALPSLLRGIANLFSLDPIGTDDGGFLFTIDEEGNTVDIDVASLQSTSTDDTGRHSATMKITEKYGDETVVVCNETIDADELAQNIVASCSKMLNDYGLVGYLRNWMDDEFPLTYFLILKDYVEKTNRLNLRWDGVLIDDEEAGMAKTDIGTEVDIFRGVLHRT